MDGVPDAVRGNVRLRLGIVLDAQGLWDRAACEYDAATRIDCPPNIQSQAAYRLAQSLEMAEEYAKAAEIFCRLRGDTSLDQPRRGEAQLRYAMCLLKSGQRDEALAQLESCRQSGSADAALKADIALAEIHESARDVARARECYERVLSHPSAEPATRAAALTRLQRLKR
jgi:tetratricopeptide (TPR) repeat protein